MLQQGFFLTFYSKGDIMELSSKHSNISKLTLGGTLVTLGVVYGDIGTSPLYVMKSVFFEIYAYKG